MHLVLFDVVDLDRTERPEADMQSDFADGDAHVFDLFQEFRREVQTGGRRRGGAQLVAVDGLVPLLVLEFFVDVRRQRHLADLLENGVEVAVIGKPHDSAAVVRDVGHGACEPSIAKGKDGARFRPLARLAEALPEVQFSLLQQQELDDRSRLLLDPVDAGRQDAGVVQDEAVAGTQIVEDVRKMTVFDLAGDPVEMEHARGIALPERCLGNQFFRQFIPEVRGVHEICFSLHMRVFNKVRRNLH